MLCARTVYAACASFALCVGCSAPVPPPVVLPDTPAASQATGAVVPQPVLPVAPAPRELVYLELTPAAERAVLSYVADVRREPGGQASRLWLRFEMVPGGCSGFQRKLWIDGDASKDDSFEYVAGGIPCLLLKSQRELVQGTRIDFGSADGRTGFIVTTPHASARTKSLVSQWVTDSLARQILAPVPPTSGD